MEQVVLEKHTRTHTQFWFISRYMKRMKRLHSYTYMYIRYAYHACWLHLLVATWRTYVVLKIYSYVNYRGRHVPRSHQQNRSIERFTVSRETRSLFTSTHIHEKVTNTLYLIPTNGHKLPSTLRWIVAVVNITSGIPRRAGQTATKLAARSLPDSKGSANANCDLPP